MFAWYTWNCSEQPFNFPSLPSTVLVKANKAGGEIKSPNWVLTSRHLLVPNPGSCVHMDHCQHKGSSGQRNSHPMLLPPEPRGIPLFLARECQYMKEADFVMEPEECALFRGQRWRQLYETVFLQEPSAISTLYSWKTLWLGSTNSRVLPPQPLSLLLAKHTRTEVESELSFKI